jgi:hypothetical protein
MRARAASISARLIIERVVWALAGKGDSLFSLII